MDGLQRPRASPLHSAKEASKVHLRKVLCLAQGHTAGALGQDPGCSHSAAACALEGQSTTHRGSGLVHPTSCIFFQFT
jgi:hypothetical protein